MGIWIRYALNTQLLRSVHCDLRVPEPAAVPSGHRAPEFYAPQAVDARSFFLPGQDQQYAMRSIVFPGFFYGIYSVAQLLGLDYHSVVVPLVRICSVGVCSLLPLRYF